MCSRFKGQSHEHIVMISIIVPCYNEEAALPYFFTEIRKVADSMTATYELCFEFIFVNDGSKDDFQKQRGRVLHIRIHYRSISSLGALKSGPANGSVKMIDGAAVIKLS